ncbi:hypothetical protein BBJ28_00014256 [Nothophytophthora sp. Chile5]|nr:hypothetical protein BBJ28_00014256 [Nothophytophthora sp. Chile5]
MEMSVGAGRPPLTVVTTASQHHAKVKHVDAAALRQPKPRLLKHRALSASSLCVTSPSSSALSSTLRRPVPASASRRSLTPTAARVSGSKYCSSPRCASPVASDTVISAAKAAAMPSAAVVGAHVSAMSPETYFRLLKKSQVLEHLLQLSSHAGESEQRVRRLQSDQARAQCVQTRVFAELERYRRQVVDAQQQFLQLLEALTALCLREEQLQPGVSEGPEVPDALDVNAEERTLQDLQNASSPSSASPSSSLETQALATVGRQRVQQLEAVCARYEHQLTDAEAALSQAIHSSASRESAAKIAQLEARNRQHEADKEALELQLELARNQGAHMQAQLTHMQERRTTLEHVRLRLSPEDNAPLFRLTVPSVLELKWQHYFPRIPRPFQ